MAKGVKIKKLEGGKWEIESSDSCLLEHLQRALRGEWIYAFLDLSAGKLTVERQTTWGGVSLAQKKKAFQGILGQLICSARSVDAKIKGVRLSL